MAFYKDARAEKGILTIAGVGDYTFRVLANGLDGTKLGRDEWTLRLRHR